MTEPYVLVGQGKVPNKAVINFKEDGMEMKAVDYHGVMFRGIPMTISREDAVKLAETILEVYGV